MNARNSSRLYNVSASFRLQLNKLQSTLVVIKNPSVIARHVNMCLKQKLWVLETIRQEDYPKMHGPPYRGSVGGHMRHSLDHFRRIIDSVDSNREAIEYDNRDRNTVVESDVMAAQTELYKVSADIERLFKAVSEVGDVLPMRVKFIGDCITGETYDLSSNLLREISFACHHATHHLFFMKLMLEVMGYDMKDSDVGVANSTLLYNKSGSKRPDTK